MLSSDGYVKTTNSSVAGNITITLPDATKVQPGQPYTIYVSNTGTVTVSSVAGLVNGSASVNVTSQYSSRTFISDGTNWQIIASVGS
jgi:biopolymer transport protein ExbD